MIDHISPHIHGDALENDTNELAALEEDKAARLAQLFQAMADTNRMRIVSLLLEHELCVHDIATLLDMSQSAVSHQMRALRHMHLVKARKEGRHVYYSLDDDHVRQLFHVGLEHVECG